MTSPSEGQRHPRPRPPRPAAAVRGLGAAVGAVLGASGAAGAPGATGSLGAARAPGAVGAPGTRRVARAVGAVRAALGGCSVRAVHAVRGGRAVRAVCAVCAGFAGFAMLTGCEKPTPVATVTSDEDSVHAQAACYRDGKQLSAATLRACLRSAGETAVLKVDPDALVRFGVDPDVADHGWSVLLDAQPLTDVSTTTYRTIPASVFFDPEYGATGAGTTVRILEGSGSRAIGLWSFTFQKKT